VGEYLLSISDTRESITYMETAFPSIALVCVPSNLVTNSQNVLPMSTEPLLVTLCSVFPYDTSPGKITSSGLSKISPRTIILRKYSIEEITTFLLFSTLISN
jgi:hypothetical protein